MLRVAICTTDNREQMARYEMAEPFFGTAMSALLQGLLQLPELVEVHVISCSKRVMAKPEKIGPNGWFHQPVVPKIGWGRTAFVGCGWAVRGVLERLQPDVVHAQGTERDCAVSMMMAPRGPRLLTIHGHMGRIAEITGARFPSYYWLAARLERMAVRRTEGVVALNEYTRRRVEAGARRTWVVPNAVDESFFAVPRAPEAGLALCVAGVHPWKRQVELIEALAEAPAAARPRRLVFFGEASTDDYARGFRAALALHSDWCEHRGHASRAELQQWLARAEMLILPSLEDNCPMVALEAMAAAVPVLAARIGGIPEVVADGVTGRLFDPQDPSSVRAAISEAVANPERLAGWGRAGQEKARSVHHPLVIARRHLDIYQDAIREAEGSGT